MRRLLALVTVLAVAAVAFVVGRPDGDRPDRHLTVMFPSTTSLYQGARVKVLGVPVGTVDEIVVEGTKVRVEITYAGEIDLPEDVHAVVVPPSVVGDRFVQLTPAYTEGRVLADGATLGLDHASVPLELEDTYRALDKLAGDLGPRGANRDGALSRLISASADNLRGRGRLLNTTVRQLADAISVLATSSDDANATTTNLARLNHRLAGSDARIRSLIANLVLVATELHGQSDDLGSAVTALDRSLGRVARFAEDNRTELRTTISDLTSISATLRGRTRELEELTDLAPVGLVNLMHTYVPRNWDPRHREQTDLEGRTGSQNLHAAALQDLSTQLGHTLSAFCASLPPDRAAELRPFCSALQRAGGDLAELLFKVYGNGGGPTAPSAREVAAR